MTVHKLTAGDGYTYLSRQVAAQDNATTEPGGLSAYYTATGEAPGRWVGAGLEHLGGPPLGPTVHEAQMSALFGEGRHPERLAIEQQEKINGGTPAEVDRSSRLGTPYRVYSEAGEFRGRCAVAFRTLNAELGLPATTPVPVEERARIRTLLATGMFSEAFGRPPSDERELSGHLARISRQRTTAVAGYDLTFSPVKSVSTLWAVATPEVAAVVERAHADAVADVLTWLEDQAVFSRTGRNGAAQVDVYGLVAAAFTHRDSRAGDPDLHTHVAISNKVRTLDGCWLALDGSAIYKNNVAASERYNTRIEALLIERLGVRFADRRGGDADKRPVREIVGIDGPLPQMWSSRRQAIDSRRAVLASEFQGEHGRPPTAREAIHLAQQANLETRDAKHGPRSEADQRATWRAEAASVLGSEERLDRYVAQALGPPARAAAVTVTSRWADDMARQVVQRVSLARATWDETHLRAEAERRARSAGVGACDLDGAVNAVVASALSPPYSIRLTPDRDEGEPGALRRRDGTSVFKAHGSAVHTSAGVLGTEQAIFHAAGRFDGHVTPDSAVEVALGSAAAAGPTLNAGQEAFVRSLATSGARVQIALAPAGTGKTTALRSLAAAWRAGGGTVVGLAPSAAASSVLRHQLADKTDTVAKFVHAYRTGVDVPDWLTTLGPSSLVIVDEAGAAATSDLAQVIEAALTAGGSVRLVGDDQQLGAIGAGGVLGDLAAAHGAVHLTEVVRFIDADTGAPNHVEGAVSLALRDGDPASLAYYADHGRLHVGDLATCSAQVFEAWSADRAAGRDPLMLAPTRELVRSLNVRARNDRLAREGAPSRELLLADGTTASAGDVVISRRNDRTLANGDTGWVTNGDRWTVAAVRPSGALDVVHMATATVATLPPDYARTHVTLGYATTVHGAQGVTADSGYTVVAGNESRQLLYVAMTRGRHTNHVFVAVTGDGDAHDVVTRDGVLPPTAVEILERVLSRDDAPQSATSTVTAQQDPEKQLSAEVDRYVHSLSTAAEEHTGAAALTAVDIAADIAVPDLTDEPAYPALRAELALVAAAGHDPVRALQAAVDDPRGLDGARDAAAVLHWRLRTLTAGGHTAPLPWLPGVPRALTEDPVWGDYLAHRAARVVELAAAVADATSAWPTTSSPSWARPLLDDTALIRQLAVWRAASGTAPSDPRPTGPPCTTVGDAEEQRRLDDYVRRRMITTTIDAIRWAAHLRDVAPGITADPFWPVLLDRLVASRLQDADGAVLLESVTAAPLPDELPAAALWWRLLEHLPVPSERGDPAEGMLATELDLRVPGSPDAGSPLSPVPAPSRSVAPGSTADVPSRARVLELNQLAADFFMTAYGGSWAQSYLVHRLGTDPSQCTSHVVGHAPPGWTTLVSHLQREGVDEDEMVAAGLATRTTDGRAIDRFRDRVVFAIRDDDGIVGWIGRRHPDGDRRPHPAVPKYLNTPETVAFAKGDQLFGLVDNRASLDGGATPVLVEGPLDALAVTVAGDGRFVGVALLGTAFTDRQAENVLAVFASEKPSLVVAMDADAAGRRAAESIFWKLATTSATRSLALEDGEDPAALLRRSGREALLEALSSGVDLAEVLIDWRIEEFADQLHTVEGQVAATRRAAQVIAAVSISQWPALLTGLVAHIGIPPDIALAEAFEAVETRAPSPSQAVDGHAPKTHSERTTLALPGPAIFVEEAHTRSPGKGRRC